MLGALLLAAGLRLHALDAPAFWFDEAAVARAAQGSLAQALDVAASHLAAPPLDYVITWGVGHLLGEHEFTLRWPEALLSLIAFALAVRATRRWLGQTTALVAAVILALALWPIRYAQELRFYSWYALGFWWVWLAVEQALRRDTGRAWFWLWLALVVDGHGHYLAWLGLVRWSLELFQRQPTPRQWIKFLSCGLCGALTLIPWWLWARAVHPMLRVTESLSPLALTAGLLEGLGWLGLPPTYTPQLFWIGFGLIGVALAYHAGGKPRAFVLSVLVVTTLVVLIVSLSGIGYLGGRYLLPVNYLWGILIADGLARLGQRWRWMPVMGIGLIGLMAGLNLATYYAWPRTNAPAVIQALPPHLTQIEIGGTSLAAKFIEGEVSYYWSRLNATRPLPLVRFASEPGPCEATRIWLNPANNPIQPPTAWQALIPPENWPGQIAVWVCP